METKKIQKLVEIIVKEHDDCIDVTDLNITIDNEKVTDIEYVGNVAFFNKLDDYKEIPLAYYTENGMALPLSYVREKKLDEIYKKIVE